MDSKLQGVRALCFDVALVPEIDHEPFAVYIDARTLVALGFDAAVGVNRDHACGVIRRSNRNAMFRVPGGEDRKCVVFGIFQREVGGIYNSLEADNSVR